MAGEAVMLEYKMQKGEELEYRSTVHSEQTITEGNETASQMSDLTMLMVQEAKEINPDGSMQVEVTIKEGKGRIGNEEVELPNVGQTIAMRMLKNGEITHSSVDMPFSQPPFPGKPVKKGDIWTEQSKVRIPDRPQPIILTYEYTLSGFKEVDGYDCAEILVKCKDSKVKLDEGVEQTISARGTTYFAHKQGRLVRSQVETVTSITKDDIKVDNKIKVVVELTKAKSAVGLGPAEEGFIAK